MNFSVGPPLSVHRCFATTSTNRFPAELKLLLSQPHLLKILGHRHRHFHSGWHKIKTLSPSFFLSFSFWFAFCNNFNSKQRTTLVEIVAPSIFFQFHCGIFIFIASNTHTLHEGGFRRAIRRIPTNADSRNQNMFNLILSFHWHRRIIASTHIHKKKR